MEPIDINDLRDNDQLKQQFAVRLRTALNRSGMTQVELAERCAELSEYKKGWNRGSINDLFTGKVAPSINKVNVIAKALNVTVHYLIGNGPPDIDTYINETTQEHEYTAIRFLAASASAGSGVERPAYIEEKSRLHFLTLWLRKNIGHTNSDKLIMIECEGDSMEPTLNDGDAVLIDRNQNNIKHGIYVFQDIDNCEFKVKRLQLMQGGKVKVVSDNTKYHPYEMNASEMHIVGKVVWRAGKI